MKVGHLIPSFLKVADRALYRNLKLNNAPEAIVCTYNKANEEMFPFAEVFSWDELSGKERKRNAFRDFWGKESYLYSKLKAQGVGLIHAHHADMALKALQYRKRLKIPLVTSFYGSDIYKKQLNPFYRQKIAQLFKLGDLFLVCSEKMRQDLINLGAPPSLTRVHYSGVNLQQVKLTIPAVANDQKIVILMCGDFEPKSGFEYGIRAFLEAAKQNEELELRIIGSGILADKYRALVEGSPFGNQVLFLGEFSETLFSNALKDAHIFLEPAVVAGDGDSQGLPIALIDAVASGCPVIATRNSGIPEIVHDGKNGFLSPERAVDLMAENILRISTELHLWRGFAEYGRQLVEANFDLEKQAEKLQAIYRQFVL